MIFGDQPSVPARPASWDVRPSVIAEAKTWEHCQGPKATRVRIGCRKEVGKSTLTLCGRPRCKMGEW